MRNSTMLQYLKNLGHYVESRMWQLLYGMPDRGLTIYGVTGTNGKTTTCYLLASVLAQVHGKKNVGMLTTVTFRIGEQEEINESKMTTLPSRKIFSYLAKMKRAGVTHVVLEVTSHALDQHRIAGIHLDGAIILNLEREHLDYHNTMERYAYAKERIVGYLTEHAPLVGKQDDPYVAPILDRAEQQGISVYRITQEDITNTHTNLAGDVNKENAAAVTLLCRALQIQDEIITKGIDNVTSVPGRMEVIKAPQGFSVIIDYAVTPDALERLYADTKKTISPSAKILATLSAAGLRDRGKRPDMARVVATYADYIVVTREDPWTEPEEQIFQDLEQGLPAELAGKLWIRIPDRKEAITTLISQAKKGDVVVLTGKGAEQGMAIGKTIIPWNEKKLVQEVIATLAV